MKAKELKDSKYFCHSENGEVVSEGYLFTEEEMAIFWSQLCKEQRELCRKKFNHLGTYHGTVVWDKIDKTTEPEFD